jgi:hypothetical protein
MAWQALFQTAVAQSNGVLVTIHLTPDGGAQRETRTTTMPVANDSTVEAFARQELKQMEAVVVGKEELTYTHDAVIDATPPGPPVDPDPELTAYRKSKSELEDFQAALSLGALPSSSNATHQALKQSTAAKWQDRFAGQV